MRGVLFSTAGDGAKRNSVLWSIAPLIGVALFITAWQIGSALYPPFILPSPLEVGARWIERLQDGTWLSHFGITLTETLLGLILGALGAFALGYLIARSALAERILSPFIVASQGVPFVAIAPLIFIWFGNGLGAKILLCALVVFFPILVNVAVGLRSVPPLWRDLFRLHRASARDTFIKLELPAALPNVLAGMRVGGTLSVIGAIAAEFVSARNGLGFMIAQGNNTYDTPLVFVGVFSVIGLALTFYAVISILIHRWVRA